MVVEEEAETQGGGGIGGCRGGKSNLSAIIQAAVGASVTAVMEGVEDVMKTFVEARATAVDLVKELLSVMIVHLRHIWGISAN